MVMQAISNVVQDLASGITRHLQIDRTHMEYSSHSMEMTPTHIQGWLVLIKPDGSTRANYYLQLDASQSSQATLRLYKDVSRTSYDEF